MVESKTRTATGDGYTLSCGVYNSADGLFYATKTVRTYTTGGCTFEGSYYDSSCTYAQTEDCDGSVVITSCTGSAESTEPIFGFTATQNTDGTWTVTNSGGTYPSGCVQIPPSSDPGCVTVYCTDSTTTETWSGPYSLSDFRSDTVSLMPDWDESEWINEYPLSSYSLSEDQTELVVVEGMYRFRFPVPTVGSAQCYRIDWVERFIPEEGIGISFIEVVERGAYRPNVAISEPDTAGTQATAVAVMTATGGVDYIRILNPGSGYTAAPTVTVETAVGGGTTATGWTASISDGGVSSISGGSGGAYLPEATILGGGGSGAIVSLIMDEQGGIAEASLDVSGSGYTSEPGIAVTPCVTISADAIFNLHMGTEIAKCASWNTTIPEGYDPLDSATWPTLPELDGYVLEVPSTNGTSTITNVIQSCDCGECPS